MAEHDDTGSVETCRIVLWRGYVKCAFYAVPSHGEPVASPFFRSRDGSPVQSGAALEAHRALVERLAAEGWEPATRGRAWYALTFRRREWSPVEELPLDEPEPAAVVPAVEVHAASPPPPPPEPAAAVPAVEAPAAPAAPPPAEPEPERVPVRERKVVPVQAVHGSRQQRALVVITAVLIALAIALGLTLFGTTSAQGKDGARIHRTQPRQQLRPQPHEPAAAAVPAARRPVQAPPTRIVVTGARGDSWMEARAGSDTGKPLFAGVVAEGQTVRVTAPVVWITFGAAGNLDLRVNGRAPVPGTFNGTVTALIAHGRVRST